MKEKFKTVSDMVTEFIFTKDKKNTKVLGSMVNQIKLANSKNGTVQKFNKFTIKEF